MQIREILHIFLANPKDLLIYLFIFFLISHCIYVYRYFSLSRDWWGSKEAIIS